MKLSKGGVEEYLTTYLSTSVGKFFFFYSEKKEKRKEGGREGAEMAELSGLDWIGLEKVEGDE